MKKSIIKEIINDLIPYKINDDIFKQIIKLLENNPKSLSNLLKEINKKPGVYIIYKKKKKKIIYVGETDDLVRRLKGDISRGKMRYHSFLRKVSKNYKTKKEEKIKKILEKEFLFTCIETPSKEAAFVIESILIRYLDPNQLWNQNRKYYNDYNKFKLNKK